MVKWLNPYYGQETVDRDECKLPCFMTEQLNFSPRSDMPVLNVFVVFLVHAFYLLRFELSVLVQMIAWKDLSPK